MNAAWHQDYLGAALLFGQVEVKTVPWQGGKRIIAVPSRRFLKAIKKCRLSEAQPGWIKAGQTILPWEDLN